MRDVLEWSVVVDILLLLLTFQADVIFGTQKMTIIMLMLSKLKVSQNSVLLMTSLIALDVQQPIAVFKELLKIGT